MNLAISTTLAIVLFVFQILGYSQQPAPSDNINYNTTKNFESQNEGWTQIPFLLSQTIISAKFINNLIGWTAGPAGPPIYVYKTTDGGTQWNTQSIGSSASISDVDFLDQNLGYCVSGEGAVFKTTNGGNFWELKTTLPAGYLIYFNTADTGWVLSGWIYRTTDGGNSWFLPNSVPTTTVALRGISFINQNTGWIVGDENTILKTTDGGNSWELKPMGSVPIFNIRDLYMFDELNGIIVGGSVTPKGYVYKTTDGGSTWNLLSEINNSSWYAVDFISSQVGWICGLYGKLYKTTDGGLNWIPEITGISDVITLRDLEFPSANVGYCVGEQGTILKYGSVVTELNLTSPNGGEEWVTGTVQNITWASTNVSEVKIEYTTNGGTNWNIIANAVPSTGIYNWAIPNTPSTTCKVRISDVSDPLTYSESANNFTILVQAVTVTAPNGGEVLIHNSNYNITWNSQNVANVKIELSVNNGASWTEIATNIASTGIYQWLVPTVLTSQGKIKITDIANSNNYDISDGIFTITSPSNIDELLIIGLPTAYELFQNYPNPFNPSTEIFYAVPEIAFVKLKVYDILGNEIIILVNEEKSAGYHKANFNAVDLSNGIYLYQLQADEFISVKKMILIK